MQNSDQSQHFDRLIQALNAELKHEREQLEWSVKNIPPAIRAKQGLAWYPLRIIETGYGIGDYPYVIVERTQNLNTEHQLNGGKPATVFSEDKDAPDAVNGVIQWVEGNRLQVMFFFDEVPDVFDYSRIGIQPLVDEKSYRDMEAILVKVRDARHNRLAELRFRSFEASSISPLNDADIVVSSHLNESQKEAVFKMLSTDDFSLLHGPPGTGKTTTLVETARQLSHRKYKLLLCAPSNAATDWLVVKCAEVGLNPLRIGNVSRIKEKVLKYSIEGKMEVHEEYKNIKTYKKKAAEFRQMASKYKRSFGPSEREQRKLLKQEARNLSKEASLLEEHIIHQLIKDADVIVCTLTGVNNKYIELLRFDYVLIDEAAQAIEPACWLAISKAEKVIIAGDPYQLPPTVKSPQATSLKLNQTLMERMISDSERVSLLTIQYRMNAEIMGFSNEWFYQNKLVAHEDNEHHAFNQVPALRFVDTAGCGFNEEINEETQSYFNREEANLVRKIVQYLDATVLEEKSIGVIAPYKQQVVYLTDYLSGEKVEVQTIDSFQGQERDIIIISLTRSNESGEIGFLKEYRRLNVAMTRARKSLWIIGDSATLATDAFYNQLMDYCEKHQAYQSAWEWSS